MTTIPQSSNYFSHETVYSQAFVLPPAAFPLRSKNTYSYRLPFTQQDQPNLISFLISTLNSTKRRVSNISVIFSVLPINVPVCAQTSLSKFTDV